MSENQGPPRSQYSEGLEEWATSVNEAISAQAEAINECATRIVTIEKAIEQMVATIQDLAKAINNTNSVLSNGNINYQPKDSDRHLNMKENFDHLYERIIRLENGV